MGSVKTCLRRHTLRYAASLAALLLGGCGGHSDRSSPSSNVDDVGASRIDDVGASRIDDVGGGQSGNEGEGGSQADSSDIVGEGEEARSFIQLGRLGPASLVRPLRQLFEEGRDGAAPRTGLYFQALFSQELILTVELPDAEEATLSFPYEAAMYLYETIDGASIDKVAVGGRVLVTAVDGGLRIELEDIVMRVGVGTTEEIFGDGMIEGDVESVCFYLAILPDGLEQNGIPYAQHVQDETWSTPFCAQYR